MAQRLGVSRNYVSMIESGREPSKSLILLLEQIEKELSGPNADGIGNRETLREESSTGYAVTKPETATDKRDFAALLAEARSAVKQGIESGRTSYFNLALEVLDELQDRLTVESMRGRVQTAVKSVRTADVEEVQFK